MCLFLDISELNKRRSDTIFSKFTAWDFNIACTSTKLSKLLVTSAKFSALVIGCRVIFCNSRTSSTVKYWGIATEVPIAPPPKFTTLIRSKHLETRHQSRDKASL